MKKMICNNIQTSISLWREYLEIVIKNSENVCSDETNSYCWLSFYGLKNIISMNPNDHLESGKTIMKKNKLFLIDNKQCLCEHGVLHLMVERKGKYIPGNVHNHMKETFIKNWLSLSVLGCNLSEDIPNFTNHDISESNMRCYLCIR